MQSDHAQNSTATSAMTVDPRAMAKHSVVVAGHRTSISLETAFWEALKSQAARRGTSLAGLLAEIDAARGGSNLCSAIRVAVLEDAQARVTAQTLLVRPAA